MGFLRDNLQGDDGQSVTVQKLSAFLARIVVKYVFFFVRSKKNTVILRLRVSTSSAKTSKNS